MTPTEITELLQRTFERVEHIHVGFTGTRRGMTSLQEATVEKILDEVKSLWHARDLRLRVEALRPRFHHGDCVGSDAGARDVAKRCGFWTASHPPINDSLRAFTTNDETYPPADYRVRDRRIVQMAQLMLATPKFMREEVRSGTWATIRDARKLFTPVIIVWSNGSSTVT